MPNLIYNKAYKDHKVFYFHKNVNIGRSTKNNIILKGPEVSRSHASIEKNKAGKYILYDKGSKNGIWLLNDHEKKIYKKYVLCNGITFRIVDYIFTFVEDIPEGVDNEKILNELEGSTIKSKNITFTSGFFSGFKSQKILKVFQEVQIYAKKDSTILITGETGTGKTMLALAIHESSLRNQKPFVKVSCPNVLEDMLESILFGHKKGAFTGAVQNRKGLFEEAHESSIFLDEIGDISHVVQIKLLNVLQDKEILRLGDTKPVPVNVRIIASTNQDLREKVKKKEFREDLYYRLNVLRIDMPALRERSEDIPQFAHLFLQEFNSKTHISDETMEILKQYPWPGNVRELRNIIERISVNFENKTVFPEDLPAISKKLSEWILSDNSISIDIKEANFLNTFFKERGDRQKICEVLGISKATFYRWKGKYIKVDSKYQ